MGTLRIYWGGDGDFPETYHKNFDLERFLSVTTNEQIVVFDRFVVKPKYRGTHVPYQLLAAISSFSLDNKVQLAFCACKPHLLNLYLKLGFRTYMHNYNADGSGLTIPLIFVCEDLAYLRQINSPLLAYEQAYVFESDIPEKVASLIAQSKSGSESANREKIEDWVETYNLLTQSNTSDPTLFQGLSEDSIAKILASSHIIECKKGDQIIISGRNLHSIFVILSGSVEIRAGQQITGVRTEGDVIGELGFLLKERRLADVVAATDNVRVLSLREKTIQQLQEKDPALTSQLMHNLARIVALKMVSLYQRTFY